MFKWLQNYKQNSSSRKIEKSIKLVSNKHAIKEERMGAINLLAHSKHSELAIPGLLKRFEFSVTNGIQDSREKENAMSGIVRFGKDAIAPVVSYLTDSPSIAWPLKILSKISDERKVVDTLKSCLYFEDTSFDHAKTDKNYDILCYLRDFKLPGYHDKLASFLKNPDERVRFAAIECLVEQDDKEVKDLIEPFIADDSAENIRIREAIIRCFYKREWKISDTEPFLDGLILPGVKVNKQGELKITEKRYMI